MAYDESASRITEFVFGIMLGLFILIIALVLIKGIQGIYNSPVPSQIKLIMDSFSGQVHDVIRYKDLISDVSSTALKIALTIARYISKIISFFT